MADSDLHLVSLYHTHEKEVAGSILADATYEDLNMDDFFCSVDCTSSRIGQQYLYHLLHYNKRSGVEEQEELIGKLTREPDLRLKLIDTLKKLHHPDAYYIASLFTGSIPEPPRKKLRLLSVCRFFPFVFLGLMLLFHQPLFVILLVASLVANAILHYRDKAQIHQFCFSVPQLVRLLQQAEKLCSEEGFLKVDPGISATLEELQTLKKQLISFRLSIRLDNDMALLAYLFTELVNIFFLTEAYSINKAFVSLTNKQKQIKEIFVFVGKLDVLCSISLLREQLPYYCLPQNCGTDERLIARSVYHPLIEDAVSNDITIDRKSVLITGSNMSGKTSFIRTIGINLLSAKILNTCFARHFCVSLTMKLSSAIHTADSLTEGKSYFLQEVDQTKRLIDESVSGNYMFLLDEPFKGTNAKERIAIGKAVLSALARNGNIVLISTHDLELARLLEDEYDLYYFSESVQEDILSFDYKVKKGIANERNAIKMLEIFEYPEDIIRDAYSHT